MQMNVPFPRVLTPADLLYPLAGLLQNSGNDPSSYRKSDSNAILA